MPMLVSASPARMGMTTRKGTTARSWNSRMPRARRPCRDCSSSCSVSCRATMAVDDNASAPPTTSAPSGLMPLHQAMPITIRVVSTTWAPPKPSTARRMERRWGMEISSPIMKSRKMTPASPIRWMASLSGSQPRAWGPATTPTKRYPRIGGSWTRRSRATATTDSASRVMTSTMGSWVMDGGFPGIGVTVAGLIAGASAAMIPAIGREAARGAGALSW